MSFLRPFQATDILKFNNVNLDAWTETYTVSYYLNYLCNWPDLMIVVEHPHSNAVERRTGGEGEGAAAAAAAAAARDGRREVGVDRGGLVMGYTMGKTEGRDRDWHGHLTAISVAPSYRRLGLAAKMMSLLERMSDLNQAWFLDLYVRVSNDLAVQMYEGMGYSVFRRVKGYYSGGVKSGDEDAFDMRKALSKDKNKISVRSNGREYLVRPEDCWM